MWTSKFISPLQARWRIQINSNSTFQFFEECYSLKPTAPANMNPMRRAKSCLWRNKKKKSLFLHLAFSDGYLEGQDTWSVNFEFHCYVSSWWVWLLVIFTFQFYAHCDGATWVLSSALWNSFDINFVLFFFSFLLEIHKVIQQWVHLSKPKLL